MDIVIVSEFCGDFSAADNDRFLYVAKLLAQRHTVELITSSFFHTTKNFRRETAKEWPFKVTFIEEPGYPVNVCLRRFYSHYVWGRNVGRYLRNRKKPDAVYCAVPSLSGAKQAADYCRKNHVRFVVDIQDLWPEAFQMIIRVPLLTDIAFLPFRLLADSIYRQADAICAVSETYAERALKVSRKCDDAQTVYLGTELDTFDRYALTGGKKEMNSGKLRAAYCGTLGSSYDLTCVIDAVALLKKRNVSVQFVVLGDGPRLEEFREYAALKGIDAEFEGRLPYDRMCRELCSCDITVNPITHNAAQSIINKHADYAASGLPVISTQENREYRKLVRDYRMGYNCRNNDAEDLADKIQSLAGNPERRQKMGRNARRCAEERFDRKRTYQALVKCICGEK